MTRGAGGVSAMADALGMGMGDADADGLGRGAGGSDAAADGVCRAGFVADDNVTSGCGGAGEVHPAKLKTTAAMNHRPQDFMMFPRIKTRFRDRRRIS